MESSIVNVEDFHESQFVETVSKSWCCTKMNIAHYQYIWVIEGYSFLDQSEDMMESPVFPCDGEDKTKWSLRFYPHVFDRQSQCWFVSIQLNLVATDKPYLRTKYELSILGQDQALLNKTTSINTAIFSATGLKSVTLHKFLALKRILEKPDEYTPDNKFTLLCDLYCCNNMTNYVGSEYSFKSPPLLPQLADNLSKLLQSEEYSDVTIVVEGKEIKAHKNILAARSPVFSAMFEHNMAENIHNKVIIEDLSFEVMKELIHFMYTADVPNIDDMPDELLVAADKYALEWLKLRCEELLCNQICIEKAVPLLILADRHSAPRLKDMIINFITYTPDVIESDYWAPLRLAHPNLLEEICQKTLKKIGTPTFLYSNISKH